MIEERHQTHHPKAIALDDSGCVIYNHTSPITRSIRDIIYHHYGNSPQPWENAVLARVNYDRDWTCCAQV